MSKRNLLAGFVLGLIWVFTSTAGAADSAADNDTLIFGAPPRGTAAEEAATYEPITAYLSQVTGKKVLFEYAQNWLVYSKDMVDGKYDLVFDGPHFNGWRMERLSHTPLVRLPEGHVFVVIVRTDEQRIHDLRKLAGRTVCAHASPNLGTLALLSQFNNPVQQPVILEVQGWDKAYDGLIHGDCVAAVLPIKSLEKFDNNRHQTRIIYQHRSLPNQAVSAGPRVPPAMQRKIAAALLSEESKGITSKLRSAYGSKDFVPAHVEDYSGLGSYLKDVLYFSDQPGGAL
jgi:ABC-type phosphate/phosphonate transport system substrate-binding protein